MKKLSQFIQPAILKTIGFSRVTRLLEPFTAELKDRNIPLPPSEEDNGDYLSALAAAFSGVNSNGTIQPALSTQPSAPAPPTGDLLCTLLTLEAAASPENQAALDAVILRRMPCVAVSDCPLDRALELWFIFPDELAQFAPAGLAPAPACRDEATQSCTHEKATGLSSVRPAEGEAEVLPETIDHQLNNHRPPPPPVPIPSIHQSKNPSNHPLGSLLNLPPVTPAPDPVDGRLLLDTLVQTFTRFVVLPKWAAETLALWVVHTYAFLLRDVTTYIGLESPAHRCGKSTLITVLSELANRAVVASNVSSPALYRVIEQIQPALLIDEADTFMYGNEELRGILNSGYHRKTAYVLRAVNQQAGRARSPEPVPGAQQPPESGAPAAGAETQSSGLANFSCWCPKVIARIGRLPATLADRCIVFGMQRKTPHEECERLRNLDAYPLKQQCARFVADHSGAIAAAKPGLPSELNDRATDIWEPLLVLADLAGGHWPDLARQAAVAIAAATQDTNPIGSLLMDIFLLFAINNTDRLFSQDLVLALNTRSDRPWTAIRKGKAMTDIWLAQQLQPYGIRPRNIRIKGIQAKGYLQEEMRDAFRRYIPKAELSAFLEEAKRGHDPAANNQNPAPTAVCAPPTKSGVPR